MLSRPVNILALAAIAVGAFMLLVPGGGAPERSRGVSAAPAPQRTGWALERRAVVLAGGARLSWITIPSPQVPGDPLFDIHCLALESASGAALSMVCPGAEQGAFSGLGH